MMEMHFVYAHLIGDYLFQTDYMAANKKNSSLACLWHVLTYMVPFLFCGLEWWQFILIAAQHYAQDRTAFVMWFMKAKRSAGFSVPPLAPWSVILTDNILHILWMAMVIAIS